MEKTPLKRENHYSSVITKIYKIINPIIFTLSPLPKSRMHLIGEASRLIAVEINLESNSHHKQNYILLYLDESEQQCLLCRCPLCAAAAAATTTPQAERLRENPICYKLTISLDVLKCLDEKFISFSQSATFNEKHRKANKPEERKKILFTVQVVKTTKI